MKKQFILLFIYFFVALFANSSNAYKFYQISLENGLSQSTVNCIVQDHQGFLWIGTQDGLNRFDGKNIKVFRNKPENPNSLSDNFIQSLLVDSQNNLWIGTWGGGLNHYNQTTQQFTCYKNNDKNNNSISGNIIMSIYEDFEGNIWIGTSNNGLDKYNPKQERFYHYSSLIKASNINQANRYKSIMQDANHNIWIGSSEYGLVYYDIKSNKFSINSTIRNNRSLIESSIQSIFIDNEQNIWIGTSNNGLYKYSIKTNQYKFYTTGKLNQTNYEKVEITSITKDSIGNIWIGTFGNGLYQFNPISETFTNYTHQAIDKNSLSNNIVLSLFYDRQGILWVGTLGGGVSWFNPTNQLFQYIKKEPNKINSLSEDMVMSIYLDNDSFLWIGTYGGGLNKYNLKNNETKQLKKLSNTSLEIPGNIIRCIFEDSKSRIWLGTYDGVGLYNKKNNKFNVFTKKNNDTTSICSNDVWTIYEDKNGIIWLGTWNGLCRFNEGNNTFTNYNRLFELNLVKSNRIMCILQADNNCLWIGTNGGGLIKLDTKANTLKNIHLQSNTKVKNSIDRIRSLCSDNKDDLWIGTDGNGLINYNFSNQISNIYTESNGLPNNVIYSIIPDSKSNLWLSTNKGICRFNKITKETWNIDVTDGLYSNEFNQGAALKASNGEIFFGGIKGIVHFNPDKVEPNLFKPNVVITSIKLFGKEINTDSSICQKKSLSFDYSENFISFEFAALNFIASEKNQFACRMIGFDKDWIQLGNQRQISYTNLDPGKYTFQVKASNNHYIWNNDGTSITIVIHPPFWKTNTFYFLLVVSILALIFLFIQLRLRSLKQSKISLEIEVQDRTMLILNQNKEIFEKNEELQQQKEEIMMQKEHVELLNADLEQQRFEIELRNKKITDSIRYSLKIQQAILPDNNYISELFKEHFIIHFPKDIVSGDFYWVASSRDINNKANVEEKSLNNNILFATIDCTGHGVPGAFMSLMAYNFLNQAYKEHSLVKPSEILNFINDKVIETINKSNEEFAVRDGMDILLCSYNKQLQELEFSAAGMSFCLVRNGEVFNYKGDMRPIGYPLTNEFPSYTNTKIKILDKDIIYSFTDGYIDQFNEKIDRKYSTKRFKELLKTIQNLPMASQKAKLIEEFYAWKGKSEQIDDILIFAVRF